MTRGLVAGREKSVNLAEPRPAAVAAATGAGAGAGAGAAVAVELLPLVLPVVPLLLPGSGENAKTAGFGGARSG